MLITRRLLLRGLLLTVASLISFSAVAASHTPVGRKSLAPMLKTVLPAVVNINTETAINPLAPPPHAAQQKQPRAPQQPHHFGLASGIIINAEKGYILTNHHVIKRAEKIIVTLGDGRKFPAKKIGSDPQTDIAVIRIQAPHLQGIRIGHSTRLQVGDFVVAIGNPFGLRQTVTSGIVSALGRTNLGIEGLEDFIQTDASINPGNSGGALVNLKGELIGMNTAILAPEGGNIGIGFAIPIDMAKKVMVQLIKFGKVRRGLLGVMAQTLTTDLAHAFHVPDAEGAVVDQVGPDSLAHHAGIKVGDIITAVNENTIHTMSDLRNSIGLIAIGRPMELKIIRQGKPLRIRTKMVAPGAITSRAQRIHPGLAGAYFSDFDGNLSVHGHVKGVVFASVSPKTPAWNKGFRSGDVITSVNQNTVQSVAALEHLAKQADATLLLRVIRVNAALYIVLKR